MNEYPPGVRVLASVEPLYEVQMPQPGPLPEPLPEPLCNLPGHCREAVRAYVAAAVAAERERCAELCDLAESAAWALWDTEADPSDQGKAIQAAALAAEIRGLAAPEVTR